jgi:Tol biopolymer transport system component
MLQAVKVLRFSFLIVSIAAFLVACGTKYIAQPEIVTVNPTSISLPLVETPIATPTIPLTATLTPTSTPTLTITPTITLRRNRSAKSSIVFFKNSDYKGSPSILHVNSDGSNLRPLLNPNYFLIWIQDVVWSPDGKQVVLACQGGGGSSGEIYLLNADGSNLRLVTPHDYRGEGVSWSPDSHQIVFKWAEGIYKMVIDEENTHQLPDDYKSSCGAQPYGVPDLESRFKHLFRDNDDFSYRFPSWSPTGTQIAFLGRNNQTNSKDIYLTDVDGINIQQLTYNGDVEYFFWSPDGKHIAFSPFSSGEVFIVAVNDASVTNLGNLRAESFMLSWSPDNTKILFVSKRDGDKEIYMIDVGGNNLTNLTKNLGYYDVNPAWSPDGKEIAFSSEREGHKGKSKIYIMNADGSNVRRLTDDNNIEHSEYNPIWQP